MIFEIISGGEKLTGWGKNGPAYFFPGERMGRPILSPGKKLTGGKFRPVTPPYMGVIPNPKMAFIFPISCILVLIFPIFMPPKELWEAYSNRTVRPLSVCLCVRPSRFCVWSISPIFFEEGIPNLVCGCILGWRSVSYHFWVTVTLTLTSDLVFRIIVSGAYLLYYLR